MPCFRPLTGYRSRTSNPNSGKHSIVFNKRESFPVGHLLFKQYEIPCGQCRFCRLEKSRQWAMRCMHEASQYEKNCFITLTYDDQHLPEHGFLDYEAPVLFMKRLRKQYGDKIRSYGCAEYGDKNGRPHYHICLFNHDFADREHIATRNGFKYYVSEELKRLWPFGHNVIGDLTFESAAYVARYVTKKITGKDEAKHYEYLDTKTGEILRRNPERHVCVSRRPGIGKQWIEQNRQYTYTHDWVIIRGRKMKPPKYYDYLTEIVDSKAMRKIKQKREEKAEKNTEKIQEIDRKKMQKYKEKTEKKPNENIPLPLNHISVLENAQEMKYNLLRRKYENNR